MNAAFSCRSLVKGYAILGHRVIFFILREPNLME